MTRMHKIAVLDDFQNVSMNFGNWAALREHAEITVYRDHIDDEDELVERLLPYDVLCVMRERTWFRRSLLERLPNLKMIASTGPGMPPSTWTLQTIWASWSVAPAPR